MYENLLYLWKIIKNSSQYVKNVSDLFKNTQILPKYNRFIQNSLKTTKNWPEDSLNFLNLLKFWKIIEIRTK